MSDPIAFDITGHLREVAEILKERGFHMAAQNCRASAKMIERLTAERDAQKRRGDNHWETLRSIREIARSTGDIERIILWVDDAGSGYTETAEATLSQALDRARAAETERDQLRERLAVYERPPGAPEHQQDQRPLRWLGLVNRAEHAEAALRAAREALMVQGKALKPLADRVFNDNGEMSIDTCSLRPEEAQAAYFAERKATNALAAIEALGLEGAR